MRLDYFQLLSGMRRSKDKCFPIYHLHRAPGILCIAILEAIFALRGPMHRASAQALGHRAVPLDSDEEVENHALHYSLVDLNHLLPTFLHVLGRYNFAISKSKSFAGSSPRLKSGSSHARDF
jgi:hypothetical protein